MPASGNASKFEPGAKLKEIIHFLICASCVGIFGSIIYMAMEHHVK